MEYGDFLGKGWAFPLDFSNDNCVKISEKEKNIQDRSICYSGHIQANA